MKKGDYIVLLTGCDGTDLWRSIPINYVYLLREDFLWNCLLIERDINGSTTNGWKRSGSKDSTANNKMTARSAIPEEIQAYIDNGNKPISIKNIKYNNHEFYY